MGQLEIIDILCNVTAKMSELIYDMSIQLEQSHVEDEIMTELKNRQKECSNALNIAEYKLRRDNQ